MCMTGKSSVWLRQKRFNLLKYALRAVALGRVRAKFRMSKNLLTAPIYHFYFLFLIVILVTHPHPHPVFSDTRETVYCPYTK